MDSTRRSFFRTTVAGALGLGGLLLGRRAWGQQPMGGHGGMAGMARATPGADGTYPGGTGSMMFSPGHNMIGAYTEPPGAPPEDEVNYRKFRVRFQVAEHELLPGVKFKGFTFNGRVPGPVFRVKEGDWLQIEATNDTEEMHTIHWHGLDVPYTMDGVPMITQDPIHPGETFVYRFQARPAGTRFYHCHWGTPLHMSSALHGAFIVESDQDPIRKAFPYQRDYVLVLESFDLDFTRNEMNALLEGMKQVNRLMARGKLQPETHGFFRNAGAFREAVESGDYIPPYLPGQAPVREWKANFFAINGRSYPTIDESSKLKIRRGEWIRVRIVNGGMGSHHLHLHGHQFVHVAEDGNPLPQPKRMNTISVFPGKTQDIMIHGDNPGYWTFHDHMTFNATNNGIYPGGMVTLLSYEDLENPPYVPSVSIIQ